jgi:hypothetical protein
MRQTGNHNRLTRFNKFLDRLLDFYIPQHQFPSLDVMEFRPKWLSSGRQLLFHKICHVASLAKDGGYYFSICGNEAWIRLRAVNFYPLVKKTGQTAMD